MKKILFLFLMVVAARTYAQQDILLSQYMFNHLLVNPAYAGSKDYMMATLLYRAQWAGWDGGGAPTTQVASLHGPIGLTQLGWGGLISHDHEGVTDRTDIYGNLAYHLKLNEKLKLGLGLRLGGGYWVRDNAKIRNKLAEHPNEWDPTDPKFSGDNSSAFLPNIGAGVYLYSKRFYAGLSAPEVLSYDPDRSLSITPGDLSPRQVRHYFLTTGLVIPAGTDVVLRPSIMVKYTQNAPAEADINLNALFMNVLWLGVSYRTDDAVVGIVELQITKQLRLGYSYDFTMTDIKKFSDGSHEIMLGYDFGYDIMKMKTPRYF
jgi:type IX secretion system PorP/SprF family membrane protein